MRSYPRPNKHLSSTRPNRIRSTFPRPYKTCPLASQLSSPTSSMGSLLPFLLLLLFSSASLILARDISQTKTTAKLHVPTSLAAASRAASFDPQTANYTNIEESAVAGGNGIISFQLHSRDFLSTTSAYKNYGDLTLARLSRDSLRVQSITTRLALAVHGVKRSDLKPMVNQNSISLVSAPGGDGIQGPIVSGTSQGSGEYFSRVGIGSPARPQYMVLDTGSDVTWVQCKPCTDCYEQSDPLFEPSVSSSYSPVSCSDSHCSELEISSCRSNSCLYQVAYGDGSFTVGEFATETLTFGNSAPVEGVAIGCGHDNEGLFVGASGLLGLGGGVLSFPSQISAKSISYCLVDRDSTATSSLQIGAAGGESDGAVSAPLLRNQKSDTFYYVGLTGISVGGAMLSIPSSTFAVDDNGSGGVIVDSGTAVTRLQTDAYTAVRDAFVKGTSDLPKAAGVALFDTCYDLSGRNSVEVPTVGFHFPGGGELKLPAKNYLIPVDSSGTFCLAFAPTTAPLSIIGNVQQQGTRVSIDLDGAAVKFEVNKC